MKKAISTNGAPAAIGPYSQAIDCGEFVFTSGQLGLDPATGKLVDGGVQAQATQAMKNIQAVLTAAGLTLDNVVKTTVCLHYTLIPAFLSTKSSGRAAHLTRLSAPCTGTFSPAHFWKILDIPLH